MIQAPLGKGGTLHRGGGPYIPGEECLLEQELPASLAVPLFGRGEGGRETGLLVSRLTPAQPQRIRPRQWKATAEILR